MQEQKGLVKRYVAREVYSALKQSGEEKLARAADIHGSITPQGKQGLGFDVW
jgi:hypothetical protein